ncbi:hypothetical protein ACSBOB_11430 [Mesorhizobium sp. ASY16-5R]|uniref:hypothetical protein n=1 Tax=Mesorhizobium sp. ASY16-5R TaxID=3445772 RepID=UPI003FA07EE8
METVRLNWPRYRDGVKHIEADTLSEFKPVTDRQEVVPYELAKLKQPLALDFINADTKEKRIAFLSHRGFLGLPHEKEDGGALRVQYFKEWQEIIRDLLIGTTSDDPKVAVETLDQALEKPRFKLSIDYSAENDSLKTFHEATTLYHFMVLECVAAGVRRAHLGRCSHCSNYFLTGHTTGHRADKELCSPRCKTAAHRQRKRDAEKGN